MEFSWSALQRHGGKDFSAVRPPIKIPSRRNNAHDHCALFGRSTICDTMLRFAGSEPPILLCYLRDTQTYGTSRQLEQFDLAGPFRGWRHIRCITCARNRRAAARSRHPGAELSCDDTSVRTCVRREPVSVITYIEFCLC